MTRLFGLTVILALLSSPTVAQTAADFAFTYQGRLTRDGAVFNGTCDDVEFTLWDDPDAGAQVGPTLSFNPGDENAITVVNGLFSALLDFGDVFDGTALWLRIRLDCGDGYVVLSPRQELSGIPYAAHAISGAGWRQSDSDVAYMLGRVGIGIQEPFEDLVIRGDNPRIVIQNDDDLTSSSRLWDASADTFALEKRAVTGDTIIALDPTPLDGTSSASLHVFESTDTIGPKAVRVYRGDGSRSVDAQIGINDIDSFINLTGGNLGIGTSNPGESVSIVDTGAQIGLHGSQFNGLLYFNSSDEAIWSWRTDDVNSDLKLTRFVMGVGVEDAIYVQNDTGHVGIGDSSPGFRLDVNGTMRATTCDCPSDARLKEEVRTIPDALGTLLQMRGVHFQWREDAQPHETFGDSRQIGFIAQDLLGVLPEVVHQGSDDFYAVDYAHVTPLVVEAIKELHATTQSKDRTITALRSQVEEQAAEIEDLHARLARLESLLNTTTSTPAPGDAR